MSDFNSRYRNIDDEPGTIRTNTGTFDFGGGFANNDMDIMEAENENKKKQVARASQARGGSSSRGRKTKRQMLIYGIIIAIEVIILVVIWAMYISYNSGSSKPKKEKAGTESSESSDSGSINVDNDNFSLTCTKISITQDANGSPAALVYFTFVNKTDNPLSMMEVFSPSFMQAGATLDSNAPLAEAPAEVTNQGSQVSAGQGIDCAYAVSLVDTTSEITITMHDNYETFSDIGSTVVPIS